jgi:cyclopropane fatty-acyl-phospholipid synthase-like methyltransferase
MNNFWNERYAEADFAYGCEPNVYLNENISKITKGKILFPAEGEGRNAVFAAQLGYEVSAFDTSEEGQKKAIQLAQNCKTSIDYKVGFLEDLNYSENEFHAIVLIYAHVPAEIRKQFHHKLLSLLKPNGIIIFEAFGKEQLKYTSGGPKDIKMLFSEEEIKEEFPNVQFSILETIETELNEGKYHIGRANVVRFIAKKHC